MEETNTYQMFADLARQFLMLEEEIKALKRENAELRSRTAHLQPADPAGGEKTFHRN